MGRERTEEANVRKMDLNPLRKLQQQPKNKQRFQCRVCDKNIYAFDFLFLTVTHAGVIVRNSSMVRMWSCMGPYM